MFPLQVLILLDFPSQLKVRSTCTYLDHFYRKYLHLKWQTTLLKPKYNHLLENIYSEWNSSQTIPRIFSATDEPEWGECLPYISPYIYYHRLNVGLKIGKNPHLLTLA